MTELPAAKRGAFFPVLRDLTGRLAEMLRKAVLVIRCKSSIATIPHHRSMIPPFLAVARRPGALAAALAPLSTLDGAVNDESKWAMRTLGVK